MATYSQKTRRDSLHVSIPKRVSEVLWPSGTFTVSSTLFQSLKGFQRFCGAARYRNECTIVEFQSLKGFQRFCGVTRSPSNNGKCFNP